MKVCKAHFILYTIIAALLMASAIQGCTTTGYENVDTSRKAILVVDAEIRGANLLLQDLIKRDTIDSNNAINALNALRQAHAANQAALVAVDVSGDPLTAESRLATANQSLSVALILLAQFQ